MNPEIGRGHSLRDESEATGACPVPALHPQLPPSPTTFPPIHTPHFGKSRISDIRTL